MGGVRSLRLPTQGRGADHAGADRSYQEAGGSVLRLPAAGTDCTRLRKQVKNKKQNPYFWY